MAKTLFEYAAWLDERQLLWPSVPEPQPPKATPYLPPLPGVRAVTWGVYGTLLLTIDGRLQPLVDDPLRLEVALEKTIAEFNMWHSMSRKPGAPWEYMLSQYRRLVGSEQMAGSGKRGEAREVDLSRIWRKLIGRLQQKGYTWDVDLYGDADDYSVKVAYFFQSSLQGVRLAPNALLALEHVRSACGTQGVVADGQEFTLVQLVRALATEQPGTTLADLFTRGTISLSYATGYRQPSKSLFAASLRTMSKRGIAAEEVLHVASRLHDELAPAKRLGMKTALYAGDRQSLVATPAEVADPNLRPDRILTDLRQIRQIVRSWKTI